MSITKSCRVTESMSDRLGEAAEESQRLQGELVREAIRFYVRANPRGYAAFTAESEPVREARIDPDDMESVQKSVYDPAREE